MRRLLLLIAVTLAFPGTAGAGLASLEVREVPLGGERLLSSSRVRPFQLVGVHWRGSGTLELRTRASNGRWSPWRPVREEDHEAPDKGSAEARRDGSWRRGTALWVGRATGVQLRAVGNVTRARTLTVRSPVSRVPLRVTAVAGAPRMVPRSGWLADEKIRRAKPDYADALRMAHVHHTAGTNAYTPEQAPAIVRAIQIYHVKGNGWADIGYNALVDRFGTVYEGRFGGRDRNVVGAHARGFNTGSFGIAVLGDFRATEPPAAAIDGLVRTLAWRLDLAHVDPLATFNGISAGNERFNPGIPVFLRVVSGHRDTGLTTCPGERLYAQLPGIARRVAMLGLPKIYAPAATRDETGGIRLTARLSSPLAWTTAVTDSAGLELARGKGRGAAVGWTWLPPAGIRPGTRWRIETPGATSAEGVLSPMGKPAPAPAPVPLPGTVELTGVSASPGTITPNGDGQSDATTIAFTLGADANVTVTVVDVSGVPVAELASRTWRRAGTRAVVFDGQGLADGAYVVQVLARGTGGREATAEVPITITRLLGRIVLDPLVLTPNGDGLTDALSVRVPLMFPASLAIRILKDGRWVATPLSGAFEAGEQLVTWDGTKRLGKASDGAYTVSVEASDGFATARVELPFLLDATAPAVRVVSAAPPRLHVSEAATLVVRANGARRSLRIAGPGTIRIPRVERLRTLVVVARDTAGNESTLRR